MATRKQSIRKLIETIDDGSHSVEVASNRHVVQVVVWTDVDEDCSASVLLDADAAEALAAQLWHHAKRVKEGKNG